MFQLNGEICAFCVKAGSIARRGTGLYRRFREIKTPECVHRDAVIYGEVVGYVLVDFWNAFKLWISTISR